MNIFKKKLHQLNFMTNQDHICVDNNGNLAIIIMAGGLGKRMQSSLPKVLHEVNNVPMIVRVIIQALILKPSKVYIIVGKYKEIIEESINRYLNSNLIEYVYQEEALGTGHAIQCALPKLSHMPPQSKVVILSGDTPMITSSTMYNLANIYDAQVALLTTEMSNPTGYGRIILNQENEFLKIVEEKDCTEDEKKVLLVNCGTYVIEAGLLVKYLPQLTNNNAQEEYYLTDVIALIRNGEGIRIHTCLVPKDKQWELAGVNTKEQLEELNKLFIN